MEIAKYDTDKQESSVLSARILGTEQEPRPGVPPACPLAEVELLE